MLIDGNGEVVWLVVGCYRLEAIDTGDSCSDVNKDWTCKDKDKNKDQAYEDQDKDKDQAYEDQDKDKD